MSIAEFIDGMPSFDERNFSRFQSKKGRRKHVPAYISTDDKPCVQIIVDHQHNQWSEKDGGEKRELADNVEEIVALLNRKRARSDRN